MCNVYRCRISIHRRPLEAEHDSRRIVREHGFDDILCQRKLLVLKVLQTVLQAFESCCSLHAHVDNFLRLFSPSFSTGTVFATLDPDEPMPKNAVTVFLVAVSIHRIPGATISFVIPGIFLFESDGQGHFVAFASRMACIRMEA